MTFSDYFTIVFYGPVFGMLVTVLCSYVCAYILSLIAARIWISLRRGSRPSVDQIAHRTLLLCFGLCITLPVFFIFELVTQYPWHIIPFAIALLINVMILAKLFGRLREPRRKKHA